MLHLLGEIVGELRHLRRIGRREHAGHGTHAVIVDKPMLDAGNGVEVLIDQRLNLQTESLRFDFST